MDPNFCKKIYVIYLQEKSNPDPSKKYKIKSDIRKKPDLDPQFCTRPGSPATCAGAPEIFNILKHVCGPGLILDPDLKKNNDIIKYNL